MIMSEGYGWENSLAGRRILFFSPAFFGYEDRIRDKMVGMGAQTDAFDVRSVTGAMRRALLKFNPDIFKRKTELYYASVLSQVRHKKYDYILFIKCDMPTEHVLRVYRKVFRTARFCLHLWDSVNNIPNIKRKFQYFDFISSFDRHDCEIYPELHFRPLFCCDEYRIGRDVTKSYRYDLCFIGTIHSDRWRIIKELKKQSARNGLRMYCYMYLQSRFIYLFYKITRAEFRNTSVRQFRFEKLPASEVAKIISGSGAVVDIQHPAQAGLTIRTIEMLGMNKKLITTNEDIRQYDFYDAGNISVISRQNPELSTEFLKNNRSSRKILPEKYSLEAWICGVLGL